MQRERGNSCNHVLDNSPSKIILFKTRTGDEKDDNNGISNVSAYTPSERINVKGSELTLGNE